jgi:hypothetical protein
MPVPVLPKTPAPATATAKVVNVELGGLEESRVEQASSDIALSLHLEHH